MNTTFERALQWVLVHEGGYSNHPRDPGGATMRGITQRTYDAWRKRKGLQPRDVRSITDGEIKVIYKAQYWDKVSGDDLPVGLDYAMFDFAVNSGPARAAKFLQRIVGVTADGVIGAQTLAAARDAYYRDPAALIERLCKNRLRWLKRLKTFKTFGRGWTRRVMGDQPGAQNGDIGVIDRATLLARSAASIPAPTQPAPGKADPAGLRVSSMFSDPDAIGAVASTVAAAGSVASGSGPVQWAFAFAVVVAAGLFAWRLLRRAEAV